MAHLVLRKSTKDAPGRTSKADTCCKKHPKHKQSPGVCSICLREKLSQISTSSSSRTIMGTSCYSSSSSLSSYYSSSASSCSTPLHGYRFTTKGNNYLPTLLFGGKNMLTKSRSLVFVPRMKNKEGDQDKKKKAGFLSKLLRPRSKKIQEGLVHSRTVREIRIPG